VNRSARELSTELEVRLLSELKQFDEIRSLPAFAPEHLATTARFFLDITAVPMLLKALFAPCPASVLIGAGRGANACFCRRCI
jgi:hypothetical protein